MTNTAELIHDFPAFGIRAIRKDHNQRAILSNDRRYAVMRQTRNHGPLPIIYSPGSVASYAIENNECPYAARERAVSRGHELYWLNQAAVVLSAHRREKEELELIEVGMVVHFEGRDFRIEAAPNDNLRLVDVTAEGV